MRLRGLFSLFSVFAVVLASGCCCHRWTERRACRHTNKIGSAGCESCSSSFYTPCDCGGPVGPPIIAPTPIGPMPKAATLSLSR